MKQIEIELINNKKKLYGIDNSENILFKNL